MHNRSLLSLDVSDNCIGVLDSEDTPTGTIALANAIMGHTALVHLDISKNGIGQTQKKIREMRLRKQKKDPAAGLNLSGVSAIVDAVKHQKTLSTLILQDNGFCGSEVGKMFGDMVAANTALKELDLSDQDQPHLAGGDAAAFASELCNGLKRNGTLTKVSLCGNRIKGEDAGKTFGDMLRLNTALKNLDLSRNKIDAAFCAEMVGGLEVNRGLLSLNLMGNSVGDGASQSLVSAFQAHDTLISLCGNRGGETELLILGVSGAEAAMLCSEISTNRFLLKLTIHDNRIHGSAGGKVLGDMLAVNKVLKELDLSKGTLDADFALNFSVGLQENSTLTVLSLAYNTLSNKHLDDSINGVTAITSAIKHNQGLVSVNLLGNNIGVQQAQVLIKVMQTKEKLISLCGFGLSNTAPDMDNKDDWLDKGLNGGCIALILNESNTLGGFRSVNMLGNNILVEQAAELLKILRGNDRITTFCGLRGNETEINIGQSAPGAGAAMLIRDEIRDIESLTKLSFCSSNRGSTYFPACELSIGMTKANFKEHNLGSPGAIILSAWLTSKDKGALLELGLASNNLVNRIIGFAEDRGQLESQGQYKRLLSC
jgi:Ran GTPase-activating protein (RanGAP) involved in mRNA processing and transport